MAGAGEKAAGDGGSENRWRVLVCGSRDNLAGLDFAYAEKCIAKVLAELGAEKAEIVSGCARGGDEFGERYAAAHGLPVAKFPAEWDKYGKSAGYRRNLEMVEYAKQRPGKAAVIVFWNGESHGAIHTAANASGSGIPVYMIQLRWSEPRLADPAEFLQGPLKPKSGGKAPDDEREKAKSNDPQLAAMLRRARRENGRR